MKDFPVDMLTRTDWPKGELTTQDFLSNAIAISLFTDSRYNSVRGYWADSLVPGQPLGSKLWTLSQLPLNESMLHDAVQYAYEALSWLLLEDNIEDLEVDGRIDGQDTLILLISVTLSGTKLSYQVDMSRGVYALL